MLIENEILLLKSTKKLIQLPMSSTMPSNRWWTVLFITIFFLFLFPGYLSVWVSVKRIKLLFDIKIVFLYTWLVFKENLTYSVISFTKSYTIDFEIFLMHCTGKKLILQHST